MLVRFMHFVHTKVGVGHAPLTPFLSHNPLIRVEGLPPLDKGGLRGGLDVDVTKYQHLFSC
jgi:hypothetical protein